MTRTSRGMSRSFISSGNKCKDAFPARWYPALPVLFPRQPNSRFVMALCLNSNGKEHSLPITAQIDNSPLIPTREKSLRAVERTHCIAFRGVDEQNVMEPHASV